MMQEWMWTQGTVQFPMADGSTCDSVQEHCKPLYEALLGYTKSVYQADSPFSLGVRVDNKGAETLYVEHLLDAARVARLEMGPKRVRASIANTAMGNAVSAVKDLNELAPAVWFAYLHTDPDRNMNPSLKDIVSNLMLRIEDEDMNDFEVVLTNFEAMMMTLSGKVTGAETSFPVLDKKVLGPNKITFGQFRTFPAAGKAAVKGRHAQTRDAIKEFILDSPVLRAYKAAMTSEQMARIPDIRPSHIYNENEVYAYQVFKETEEDQGDLAVRVCQVTGPAAAGKSEFVEQFAANNGLPFYAVVTNESTRFDQLLDSWVPFLAGGKLPNMTADEKKVNASLEADTDGRDAVELAIEALDLPSPIEVKFDPESAWDALGRTGSPAPAQEIVSLIEERAKSVLSSLKEKIESSDTSGLTLAYKCVPSPLVSWCKTGGVLEIGEMATMRKGELSKLHDLLDFNRKGSIMTAEGESFRHDACYVFLTNNLEYDEDHPLTLPMISRMSLDLEFPQLTEDEAVDRLVSVLGCESKRGQAKDLVHAYVAIGKEATSLSLPGGIDFRNLKQVGNRILVHEFDPRLVFEKEVIHHFVQHSDPESKVSDESALMGLLDELDLFR